MCEPPRITKAIQFIGDRGRCPRPHACRVDRPCVPISQAPSFLIWTTAVAPCSLLALCPQTVHIPRTLLTLSWASWPCESLPLLTCPLPLLPRTPRTILSRSPLFPPLGLCACHFLLPEPSLTAWLDGRSPACPVLLFVTGLVLSLKSLIALQAGSTPYWSRIPTSGKYFSLSLRALSPGGEVFQGEAGPQSVGKRMNCFFLTFERWKKLKAATAWLLGKYQWTGRLKGGG